MIRRPPRSTLSSSSAASDVYKRQIKSSTSDGLASMMRDANGEPSILIRYLERYTSYQYVLSATNDGGTTLGVPSRPWLTDVKEGSLRKAPHTESTGSASYTITWIGQASHCRPQLRWSIESKRKGAGTKWVSLATDISASTYTTHNLRCLLYTSPSPRD